MTRRVYEPAQSEGHDPGCHRGANPTRPSSLDTAHCPRCRDLWRRVGGTPTWLKCPVSGGVNPTLGGS